MLYTCGQYTVRSRLKNVFFPSRKLKVGFFSFCQQWQKNKLLILYIKIPLARIITVKNWHQHMLSTSNKLQEKARYTHRCVSAGIKTIASRWKQYKSYQGARVKAQHHLLKVSSHWHLDKSAKVFSTWIATTYCIVICTTTQRAGMWGRVHDTSRPFSLFFFVSVHTQTQITDPPPQQQRLKYNDDSCL